MSERVEPTDRAESAPVIPIGARRTLRERIGRHALPGAVVVVGVLGGVVVGLVGAAHADAARAAAPHAWVRPGDGMDWPIPTASPTPVQIAPTLPAIAPTPPAVAPTLTPTAAPTVAADDTSSGPVGHWTGGEYAPAFVGAPITAAEALALDPLWAVYSLPGGQQIGLRIGERVVFVHTAAEGHAARAANPDPMTAIVQIPATNPLPEPIAMVTR